jgi:hypothetical protein
LESVEPAMDAEEPQAQAAERPAFHIIDDPHAPDVFATGAAGFSRLGPNISIAIESLRIGHATQPHEVRRVIVGRLVMSADDARRFAASLNSFLRSQGLDPDEINLA